MTGKESQADTSWDALDAAQERVISWQNQNFPTCEEWELILGACEEIGEVAQCTLKMHRGIRHKEFNDKRLRDALGDTVIYLMGVCAHHGWRLSEILADTVDQVLSRDWISGADSKI